MKKLITLTTIIILLISYSAFGQNKRKAESKKELEERTLESHTNTNGVVLNIGDTLTFGSMYTSSGYMSIIPGKGESQIPLKYSRKGDKCIVEGLKRKSGFNYALCKTLDKQYYVALLDSGWLLKEFEPLDYQEEIINENLNPIREQPENYKPFNFQGVNWNSSKNEVLTIIGDLKQVDKFVYKDVVVNNFDAELTFDFNKNDTLNLIYYNFKEIHTNENIYLEDYLSIKKILIQKYGEPVSDESNWRNSLYGDNPEEYGFAVSIGDLELITIWELTDTIIILKLYGDNYEITHVLVYRNIKTKKDKNLDKF